MTSLVHDVHGAADAAETVFLSSGLGGAAAFWAPQVPALVAAGYRVVTYDQRGTGRSGGALPQSYTIASMAEDVIQVWEAADVGRCHFVGHALGALVGLQLALDAPQRLASLTSINGWSQPNSHSARCFDTRLSLLGALGARAYVEAQPLFLYPAAWCVANADRVRAEVEHAFAHFPDEAIVRARIAALRRFDVDARLGEIAVPTLVACARDDILVPSTSSERLAQGLPNARLALVPYGAHAHNITEPEQFNQTLLAFLAEASAAR
ncbi:MAG: pyrimidine utilization protein D [Janthinobacterium lividum]